MAVISDHTAHKGTFFAGLSSLIEAAKARYTRHRVYRQTVNELSALSTRDLADLGLHRSMIRRVALQAAEDFTAR
ncbi:DUF1127 domain-containing protein [Ruegeria sediminis]|uniref:DUF1127 domain-containing protein n=1 Tax=Ruegeria sediminis TaxID=2583820 RepID=A0ABY2WZ86_9RHOB|nr:DUF1127 domain-containing protein [Ruegeria sediminis]TMV07906.1 DUF1127 domain-containing protein [Ruegeria sediminis]